MGPSPKDYATAERRYARTFSSAGWCQLCGLCVPAGDLAWDLPRDRRGESRRPLVCTNCFWRAGVPTADSVHLKIRFRVAHHKPASLSWADIKAAIGALDAVQAGSEDSELEWLLASLDERLALNRTNLTNVEASQLADALFNLESVRLPDPRAIASPPWEL